MQLVSFEEKQIAKNCGGHLPPSQSADRGEGVWVCDADLNGSKPQDVFFRSDMSVARWVSLTCMAYVL